LAYRLSEDPDTQVLLLEAGGEENYIDGLNIPFTSSMAYQKTSLDWSYPIVPQSHACGGFKDQVLIEKS
jgi:choline dehydrogenase-like flavoprotein